MFKVIAETYAKNFVHTIKVNKKIGKEYSFKTYMSQ